MRTFPADASEPSSLRTALSAAVAWAGPPGVLVYNAAALEPDSELPSAARVEDAMRTTLGGAITAVNHVTEHMRAAGAGTILLTGGGLASEPYPEWASLAAGKAALRSMAISWHKELLPAGIHVASVAVAGIVRKGSAFDPDAVAEIYWRLHRQPLEQAQREVVFLPEGEDAFYNDPEARHRGASLPVRPMPLRKE